MAETEEGLWMSTKERDRLKVLHEVRKRHITQRQAAAELGISVRWVRMLLKRLRVHGDRGLWHRLRGKRSNHKASSGALSIHRSGAEAAFFQPAQHLVFGEADIRLYPQVRYLSCLRMRARAIEIRENIAKQCTAEIRSEIARARDAVKMTQSSLAYTASQQESIISEAKRKGQALIEGVRAQGEAEIRRARIDVEAAERSHAEADQDTRFDPSGWHVGLGCLCGCVTHFVVAGLIIYALYGPRPGYVDNPLLAVWILTGWILFVVLYGHLFMRLSTWPKIRRLKNAESEKREALEQTKTRQDRLLREAQLKADTLFQEANAKVQNQFAERVLSLKNDLRQQDNRITQAGSFLSTFTALK